MRKGQETVDNSDRFDKFTEQARKVLSLAQEEAQRFQHNYIGTEHLLLGLIREDEGIAAKVLNELGVKLGKIRSAVEFIIGRGDHIMRGELGLTPRAKKILALAVDEARLLHHHHIGTEHLLLGLVREGQGIAAGVLESLGVNLGDVREQTIKVLEEALPPLPQQQSSPSQVTDAGGRISQHATRSLAISQPVPPVGQNQVAALPNQAPPVSIKPYFIAYSRRDFYFAESLFYALHSKSIEAWMDIWKIVPGANWDNDISEAIKTSAGLLLIATKESLKSPFVRDELCRSIEAQKPIYLLIRGRFSKEDLHITHKYDKGKEITVDLSIDAKAIVDMRGDFVEGLARLMDVLTNNTICRDKLPSLFNVKTEAILCLPPMIVLLTLLMVVTEVWRYGIGRLYGDQWSLMIGYLRDVLHGSIGSIALFLPLMFWNSISFGGLLGVLVIGFNFSRRRYLTRRGLLFALPGFATIVGIEVLMKDVPVAFNTLLSSSLPDSFGGGTNIVLSLSSNDKSSLILLWLHGIMFLLLIVLSISLFWMYRAENGRGQRAILRWLPTGQADEHLRWQGNAKWIKDLPSSQVSPEPAYKSYYIVASPEDRGSAQSIQELLRKKGYTVTDKRELAECDLVVLSPFANDSPLKKAYQEMHSKPVIYVLVHSMNPRQEASFMIQWIDFRRTDADHFWKQWKRHFANVKGSKPVFPYVPEGLFDLFFPITGSYFLLVLALGSALLWGGLEYLIILRSATYNWFLGASIVCLLIALVLNYYMVLQMLRGMVSYGWIRRNLFFTNVLTMVAAFLSQSRGFILGSLGIVLSILVMGVLARPGLRKWLPLGEKKPDRGSLLRPLSLFRILTSYEYLYYMIIGSLVVNSLFTFVVTLPLLPLSADAGAYAVTVPGPYNLSAPGSWSEDTLANTFGFHFTYQSDNLEVAQDQGNAHVAWIKFSSSHAYPMRFSPHFSSSIHIHFINKDGRTGAGLALNDFVGNGPSVEVNPIINNLLGGINTKSGPQFFVFAAGFWNLTTADGKLYDGKLAAKDVSQDYTLEVEVNGILCTYKINGTEVATIADPSASSVDDILLDFVNYAPGGTRFYISNFTYTPLPGPVLSQSAAMRLASAHNTVPYTTVDPGWSCNSANNRWSAAFEPTPPSPKLTCTSTGTLLSSNVWLKFANQRYGGLPEAFDYSFRAAFQGTSATCIFLLTYTTTSSENISQAYVLGICADGTWAAGSAEVNPTDMAIVQAQRMKIGHISIKSPFTFSSAFHSSTQSFFVNGKLLTSYTDSALQPTILFSNEKGSVLYSNFSFTPQVQQ